ncbi:crooked neck-like protein 1 [Pyrus ussuriensis x Pyrus communis]|uniref:Crooked neck-like protein 1 n=1 Tax=Pyrus ussuriensis x Pyrus communis TaxID=2448454 RepID=A0A5N5HLH9_9ROSA|nr:crooked neck-like protein 1 [Pyrus ussuriensis x Pyrus communis]
MNQLRLGKLHSASSSPGDLRRRPLLSLKCTSSALAVIPKKLNKKMPIVTEGRLPGYEEYDDCMFSQLEAACKCEKQQVKQHGTTILLSVSPDHVLIAADSRLTSYANEIQRRPQFSKISELSSSPAASGCFCGDVCEGTNLLTHLGSMNGVSMIDSANQYLNLPPHQAYGAFVCLKSTEFEEPRGYRLFNTIKVPIHCVECRHEVDWSTCNCPRLQEDSGCIRMEEGIHFMGSGARPAINYCEVKYMQKRLRSEERSRGCCFSLLGGLDIELIEAMQDAFETLLIASLIDPSSVHGISKNEVNLIQKSQTFLEACRTHYDCLSAIMVNSIFLVSPTCLEKMDILTSLGIKRDEIKYSGHPLTWLQGEFTLQLVSFNASHNVSDTLKRAKRVRIIPEFTNNIVGMRFFSLVHEKEGHQEATYRVYVSDPTPEFLNGLIE